MALYAVVLPAGSGKSTLSQEFDLLVDIDKLHTPALRRALSDRYKRARATGDWAEYNAFEAHQVREGVASLSPKHVLLVHHKEKADLLGLVSLGAWKTSREVMRGVAALRQDNGLTEHSWESLHDAIILPDHSSVAAAVLGVCTRVVWK